MTSELCPPYHAGALNLGHFLTPILVAKADPYFGFLGSSFGYQKVTLFWGQLQMHFLTLKVR